MSKEAINTLRLLSAEQIQQANSGHPGLPLGCALLYPHGLPGSCRQSKP